MLFQIRRGGAPADWIPVGGCPAAIIDEKGWHTLESYDREVWVVGSMLVLANRRPPFPIPTREPGYVLVPFDYPELAATQPDGLIRSGSVPFWQPVVRWSSPKGQTTIGSQGELFFRLCAGSSRKSARKMVRALDRADELLKQCLCPQQRIDYLRHGHFYVPGRINQLYCVRLGNGFAIADPATRVELVDFCLHPDQWIPEPDVALAIKLLIDSGQEKELLEAARFGHLDIGREASDSERHAWELEQALYPVAA